MLFLEFVIRAAREPELREELGSQRAKLRGLIAAEVRGRLEALEVEPSLSADQLAIIMLALSNGLAIEQLISPQGIDPDLFERTVELLTVGLLHSGRG